MAADPLLPTVEFTSEVLAAPLESTGKLRKQIYLKTAHKTVLYCLCDGVP